MAGICFFCQQWVDAQDGADHWRSCPAHPARTEVERLRTRLVSVLVFLEEVVEMDETELLELQADVEKELGQLRVVLEGPGGV